MSMDPKTYPEWQGKLLKLLVATTKAASSVGSHDVSFERSINSQFNSSIDNVLDRMLSLSNRLLKFGGRREEEFEDEEDLENRWTQAVDDTCVDEFSGATTKGKDTAAVVGKITKTVKGKGIQNFAFYRTQTARPQLKFKTPPDNVEGSPWHPLLKEKPNAMLPLDQSLQVVENGEEGLETTQNPYQYEITNSSYPPQIFDVEEPAIPPTDLEENELIWVDNISSLRAMLKELRQASEIAIDLEHHDYRSYYGFVCLMQISTRTQDWIVDTLELREELIALNEVFTDPKIVKVLHGASSDVIWLQRDFGLYLVSLFDTYFASTVLQFPSKSLAYLLLKYVDIEADKKYQLADWRTRPIPPEMMAYARSDTHYLLYIYDRLRQDLAVRSKAVDRDLLNDVLTSSRQQAMASYQRERYDFEEGTGVNGWRKILLSNKGPNLHSTLQLTVFKRLHRWRDQIAREEDESVSYVLPNRSLVTLSAALPHTMQGVVAACNPVPPLVQVYAEDIAYIIQKTRKELAEEAEKAESTAAKTLQGTSAKNGITGSTHVWYKDENTAPNGVKAAVEAVKHGTQFDVWGNQQDKLHSLILPASKFWAPLHREHVDTDLHYEAGGNLEDIKLSVPLPPLTAQIYMTEEDVKPVEDSAEKEDVAALAEHPFVSRSQAVEKKEKEKNGSDVIVLRKPKSSDKKKRKASEKDKTGEEESVETAMPSADEKPLRKKKKKSKPKKALGTSSM